MATHRILRQRFVLEAPGLGPASATSLYERLAGLQADAVLPALERQFDRVGGEAVHIERLEVTVTVDGLDRLEAAFDRHFEEQVAREIDRLLGPAPSGAGTVPAGSRFTPALLVYLRTGNLAWPFAGINDFSAALTDWLATATRTDWAAVLRELSLQPGRFLRRGRELRPPLLEHCWQRMMQLVPLAKFGRRPPTDPEAWTKIMARIGPLEVAGPATNATEPTATAGDTTAVTETYYPPNAGLVLLHPYLDWLLAETRCETLARAATLFHFAVFGNTEAMEWDLPLTKVLLGLHPDELLQPEPRLVPADRRRVAELLDGIIAHWAVLKNTSRDGLREGFLVRPGKLERRGGGWRLTVEQRPHDLLLERLPWSVTPVKTARMKSLLRVDWS